MNALLDQVKAAADKLADQTEEKGGNFEYEPPAAGNCIARFVSYVEVGTHNRVEKFEKPPAPMVIVEFELLGKKHAKEIEVEVDGQKVKKTIYPKIRVGWGPNKSGHPLPMPGGSKSNHYKLLKAMAAGRDIKHMAHMLGESFVLGVVHNEVGEGKDKRVYANIRDANGWKVGAPVDPMDGSPLMAPEATVPLKLLLWDAPSIEQWNSIFMDGTYTKKEGEKEIEVSKNWMQALCLEANDFKGSALETVLAASAGGLPDMSDAVGGAAGGPTDDVVDLGDAAPSGSAEAPDGEEDDPLAGINL